MRWIVGLLTLAVVGLVVGVGCSRPAEETPGRDAPMFGGTIQRNMVNLVEKGILDDFNLKKGKEVNVKWSAKLGTYAYGSPVVAGGRVFVGTNNHTPRDPAVKGDKGVLMCFRESDGKFLWQAVHDKLESGEANDYPEAGIASTPVVEGDRLYYVSNRCELVCADVAGDEATGKAKILWTLDMMKDLKVYPCQLASSSPLIVGDLVFTITGNGVNTEDFKLPEPEAPSFVAVNKKTGKVVWQSNAPGKNVMEGQWSNPTAGEVNGKPQVIFPGGDGWLYGFEPATGKLLWKFDCNPKAAVFKPGGRGDRHHIVATPVLYDDKVYVAVGIDPQHGPGGPGHLWCIDAAKEPKNDQKDLSPVGDNFDPKAEVNKDSGLVWHVGGAILPKPDEGREFHFGRTISTVAIHDGLVYAGEFVGYLSCFDAKTGKKYWEYDLRDNTWCSPYYVDGKVFMGTDSDLHVFAPGKELKEPKKIAIPTGMKVSPVAAHGVLYLNTGNQLSAIAAK